MPRSIFILFLILSGLTNLKAQTSFSCTLHQYCYWSESSKNYQNCKGFEENSLFVVGKDEKYFTHEILNMKTTYLINEKQYNKENDVWIYEVTSEDGKKYSYTFDPRNKEIFFVPKKSEKTVMQTFSIKTIF